MFLNKTHFCELPVVRAVQSISSKSAQQFCVKIMRTNKIIERFQRFNVNWNRSKDFKLFGYEQLMRLQNIFRLKMERFAKTAVQTGAFDVEPENHKVAEINVQFNFRTLLQK